MEYYTLYYSKKHYKSINKPYSSYKNYTVTLYILQFFLIYLFKKIIFISHFELKYTMQKYINPKI